MNPLYNMTETERETVIRRRAQSHNITEFERTNIAKLSGRNVNDISMYFNERICVRNFFNYSKVNSVDVILKAIHKIEGVIDADWLEDYFGRVGCYAIAAIIIFVALLFLPFVFISYALYYPIYRRRETTYLRRLNKAIEEYATKG